jgi:hypothetical protein
VVQRGFMRRGAEELQNRFLGGKERAEDRKIAPDQGNQRNSTDDLIRRGLESLFKR